MDYDCTSTPSHDQILWTYVWYMRLSLCMHTWICQCVCIHITTFSYFRINMRVGFSCWHPYPYPSIVVLTCVHFLQNVPSHRRHHRNHHTRTTSITITVSIRRIVTIITIRGSIISSSPSPASPASPASSHPQGSPDSFPSSIFPAPFHQSYWRPPWSAHRSSGWYLKRCRAGPVPWRPRAGAIFGCPAQDGSFSPHSSMDWCVSHSCNRCNTLPGAKHWSTGTWNCTSQHGGPLTYHKPEMMRIPPIWLANHHQKPMKDVKATMKALLRLHQLVNG